VQVASYAFLFPNEQGVAKRMLLPLLDLVNHADGREANMEIMQADNGDFYAYTLRDIARGEEVSHTSSDSFLAASMFKMTSATMN